MGRNLIFDLEGDGLLEAIPSRGIKEATRFWCNAAIDMDTGEELYWGPPVPEGDPYWTPLLGNPTGTLEDSFKAFAEADFLLGHNAIGFDYPVLEKLVPGWKRPKKAWDTMVIAKVVWPYDVLFGPDLALAKRLGMDGRAQQQFVKRHSLKAWGIRTGTHKADYSGGFEAWSPEMAAYLMDDVRATFALWKLIRKRIGWDASPTHPPELVWPERVLEVENEVARIIDRQTKDGIKFDRKAAEKLSAELSNVKHDIEQKLVATFGSWWAAGPTQTPAVDRSVKVEVLSDEWTCKDITVPRFGKNGKPLAPYVGPPKCHYAVDATFTPIERTTFNPGSRDHLGQRLQAVFGWKPKKFGSNGKPTVDESVLEEIPEAVMPKETRQLILDYFVVNKTLGMLYAGKKSWIGLATEDDRIHGRMDASGAVTGRGTHMDPNMSQVPSVKKEKVKHADGTVTEEILRGLAGRYGYECRALMVADDGWEQTGVDASALELIDLGHYLQTYDGGAFTERVCDPTRDPHKEHGDLSGLTRADAKTATYLYVYGGSAYKLSLDITVEPDEVPHYLTYRGLSGLLNGLAKRFDQEFVDKMDDNQKAKLSKARQIILAFERGITGIKELKEHVSAVAKQRGWLKAMDGRKLHVRKPHAALNTLLQSAGAQTCKLWMMLVHQKLEALGLVSGVDFKQVLWVHDELQFTHRPGLGDTIKRVAEEAMVEAGVELGLRGRYRTDGKTGRNWAECH